MKKRVAFLSVVPSPYQRDLFHALSQRPEIDLQVFYLEAAAPDSPWPEKPLAAYEQILPGFWMPIGNARCHLNWELPDIDNYDLVVLNSLMSLTAQKLMRFNLKKKPWIFWGEKLQDHGNSLRGLFHGCLSSPLHRANAIVGIGTRAYHDYRVRFPEPKHFNIPYYCNLEPFLTTERSIPNDDVVFLFCGQMIRRKGIDLLLQAFHKLVAHGLPIKLLLVGREAELPSLLAEVPPQTRARIEYAGFQAPEALPEYFASADVFVLPSRYDGWGVVVNQALGAGLAVICSDAVGAAYDLVDEDVNGFRFPSGNLGALVECMEKLALSPQQTRIRGMESQRKAAYWLPSVGAAHWAHVIKAVVP